MTRRTYRLIKRVDSCYLFERLYWWLFWERMAEFETMEEAISYLVFKMKNDES